jgi:hypothetical protein
MPKGTNQKLKPYYLSHIVMEKTDDEHVLINMGKRQKITHLI